MGVFEKAMDIGEKLEIEGEELILKPLGTEMIPDLFKAMKAFSGASGDNATVEDTLKNITDDGLKSVQKLIDRTLEVSYPDKPKSQRDIVGMKYMSALIGKIMEINSYNPRTHEEKKKQIIKDAIYAKMVKK